MANTIMTAKNSFAEGLIMDFAPDNTQATCLTSALNATLLTFNGNEMSLLNDMGNGRVETARLPEGYIPVGTCEFGDIIYIVSYNPLTDKSLIGCFPSPERNISSEEMSDMFLTLTNGEFQGDNGELKRTSVKKVLIDKKLNPGDKYIIYTDSRNIENSPITANKEKLSDYGEKAHNVTPKIIKLHVVSIEDSGKITYLDSTTKWYGDYYVNSLKNLNDTNKPDIDSYRNLLDSGWSIFSSKVSGKLAILAELETIDSFSCSYTINLVSAEWEDNIKYKKYSLSLIPSYEAKEGVSLAYICATKAYFNNNSEDPTEINYYCATTNSIIKDNGTDEIASNTEGWIVEGNNISIDTEFEFKIPYKERREIGNGKYEEFPIRSDSFIYNIEITPAMSFGRLDYLKVLLTIDFNKIGTGDIDFDIWKYHNSEDSAMLTFGINTYPKPGYEVKYITMDFYDNQGRVMLYLLDGKVSYNGVFNEYFSLNGKNSNSKMSKYYAEVPVIEGGNSTLDWRKKPSEWRSIIDNDLKNGGRPSNLIQHKGNILEEKPESYIDEYIEGEKNENGEIIYYLNDAGILYSGALYAVRILIHLGPQRDFNVLKTEEEISSVNKEVTEKLETTTYYKWYWTTSMFNEYYYNTNDFNTLKFELALDTKAVFATNPETYIWKTKEVNNLGELFGNEEHYKTYSANIQYIGENGESNIDMYVLAGLQNDYGCFNLFKDNLDNILIDVSLSLGKLEYLLKGELYEFSGHDANITDPWFLYKENITKNDGDSGMSKMVHLLSPLNTHKRNSENLKILDDFNINFSNTIGKPIKTDDPFTNDEGIAITNKTTTFLLSECYYLNIENKKPIPLSMSATILNKAYVQDIYTGNVSVPVYTPIIDSIEDMDILGLWGKTNNTSKLLNLYMSGGICLNAHGNLFNTINFVFSEGLFTSAYEDDQKDGFTGEGTIDTSSNKEFLEKEWYPIASSLPEMFLVYPGGNGKTHCFGITGASWKSPLDVTGWRKKHQEGTTPGASASAAKKSELFPDKEYAFDISGTGLFSGMDEYNTIAFLGMKHKEGFTVFNSAFKDMAKNNILPLIAGRDGTIKEYENFAYLLFLLLTNTYHKNKRIADKLLNLKNYVRNGDSDITFTKNIVTKAYENPEVDPTSNDILMRGISFNEYVNAVKLSLKDTDDYYSKPETETDDFDNSLNILVRFIDCAINNVLTITIKSKPFSFLSAEVEAYLSRNGVLIPTFNLADNTFYIYEKDMLEVYSNKPMVFSIEEINKRIKHIYGDDYKLAGIHPPSTEFTTNFQNVYNLFVGLINDAMLEIAFLDKFLTSFGFSDPGLVASLKQEVIGLISLRLPDYIDDYSKQYLLLEVYDRPEKERDFTWPYDSYGWYGGFENFFDCNYYSNTGEGDKFTIEVTARTPIKEQTSEKPATEYTFNCGFNLRNAFTYDGKLLLKSDRAYNKFGLRDDPTSNDSDITGGFGGFMKDVIIDKEFQVVI